MPAKKCEECKKQLVLKNKRDIERKRFCSRRCLGRFVGKQRDMTAMWAAASTPKVNAKKGHPGSKNHKWIKNRKKVKRPITSYEGKVWRTAVYKRDNYTCQECGQRGGQLNAHHVKPYSLYPRLRFDVANGQTLCVPCHKETDTYGGKIHARAK